MTDDINAVRETSRKIGPTENLIGGKWLPSHTGERIDVIDPATGRRLAQVPNSDRTDVDRAVAAAASAFKERRWLSLGAPARAKILWKIADLLEANMEELAHLETLNNGMPIQIANFTIPTGAEMFRYYAGWCTKLHGQASDLSGGATKLFGYTRKEPVGVAAMITPWNAPLSLASTKLAAALAAGCTCVLKPAEETPLTTLRLGELMMEAGVPDGVVNIVTGYGETAGAALAAHPGVAKIAFTGSGEVGKLIVRAAAGNLKKVSLELGGKSPVVVLEDADISQAVQGAAQGIYINSGQICVVGSRLYVHRAIFDKVVGGIADVAKSLKIGNGLDPATQIGPLISARQLARVTEFIEGGVKDGAELVTGGRRVGDSGYFVEPTIFAEPRVDSPLVREEIFGPVLTAMRFDDLNDVIAAANDTTYGLAAAVWTHDVSKAHLVAEQLQAGMVWINCQLVTDPSMPFGGIKQSGWGHEMGREGLDAYLQTKSVFAML